MKTFIKLVMFFLSKKKTQELLIEMAEKLAGYTKFEQDDLAVEWFKKLWQDYHK